MRRRDQLLFLVGIGVTVMVVGWFALGALVSWLTATTSTSETFNSTVTSELANNTVVAQYQFQALGYVGQLAIGHAALVFATLTAAFTFATGFRRKLTETRSRVYSELTRQVR